MFLYRIVIFLGAFLLFVVQPILAKFFLPWFGGSASVWAISLLFFTTALLVGYLYAHGLSRLTFTRQKRIHGLLLLLSVVLLVIFWVAWGSPLTPGTNLRPDPAENPSFALLLRLMLVIGLPYLSLAATSPLLQSWLHRSGESSPYGLYALSNAGSIGALLLYPFLIEPFLSLRVQSMVWGGLFIVFAICLVALAFQTRVRTHEPGRLTILPKLPNRETNKWILYSSIPAFLLLAVTNMLTQGIASFPFLWVGPLLIYLLTFILAFSGRVISRTFLLTATVLSSLVVLLVLSVGVAFPLPVLLICFSPFLFFSCLFFHQTLYRIRPEGSDLTRYYVWIAFGGALGTILVAVIFPVLFARPIEPLLGGLVALYFSSRAFLNEIFAVPNQVRLDRVLMGFIGIIFVCFSLSFFLIDRVGIILEERNFYGALQVRHETLSGFPARLLRNGRIVHGAQFSDDSKRLWPTTYYGRDSGVGLILSREAFSSRQIAVVGLGVGTVATYCRPGDRFRFFEIDPAVEHIAREQFSYVHLCAGSEVVIGDARLSIEAEADDESRYDVMILDAFTDDAIPIHLLTREAIELYFSRLKKDGILVVHISNVYLDLIPVLRGAAVTHTLSGRIVHGSDEEEGTYANTWVLLSTNESVLPAEDGERIVQLETSGKQIFWNDMYSNLLSIIRF